VQISRIFGPPTGEPQGLNTSLGALGALQRPVAGLTDEIRADSVLLQSRLGATLAAELPLLWESSTVHRSDGAIAYEAARRASAPEIALIHLERAIKADPAHATVAINNPAFLTLREPVVRLIERLTATARAEAEAATRQAGQAVAAEVSDTDPDLWETALILKAPLRSPGTISNSGDKISVEISRISAPPAGEPHSLTASGSFKPLSGSLRDAIRTDSVLLQSGLGAALAAELIRLWEVSTTQRSEGAIAYEAARRASTPETALIHLERAISADPGHAITAISDPEFVILREPIVRMIEYLTAAARVEAQTAIRAAEHALAAEAIDADPDRGEAAAILNASEVRYQLNTYAGYIEAAIAARLASQIAVERAKARNPSKTPIVDRMQRATEKLERIGAWAADGVGRLWKRFPLFAILLGWFGAGGGFGVLTWAFGRPLLRSGRNV
jgi:hypothetical protein